MSRVRSLAAPSSIAAMILAVSCGSSPEGGDAQPRGGFGGAPSASGGRASEGANGGQAGDHGAVSGEGSGGENAASGGAGNTGDGGAAGEGDTTNTGGATAGGANGGDDAGSTQSGATSGGDSGTGAVSGAMGDAGTTASSGSADSGGSGGEALESGAGGSDASDGGDSSADAGGSNGSGGEHNCGEVIANPGCADADPDTIDFQSVEFGGCLHWSDLGAGKGWIHYETSAGFHYDLNTGLGWVVVVSAGTLTQAEAAAFCSDFSIAGLSDWRLPTIDEARSLAGGCPDTAPGGSCPLEDAGCLTEDCGLGDACSSCTANLGPRMPGNYYCRAEAKVCQSFHTTSLCPDCSNPGDWRYSPLNGNFYASTVDEETWPVCVMENIPNAIPCSD